MSTLHVTQAYVMPLAYCYGILFFTYITTGKSYNYIKQTTSVPLWLHFVTLVIWKYYPMLS